MLGFFRKYQKVFFLVITVVVIVSFSFFGVSRMGPRISIEEKDRQIGIALDGSPIMKKELMQLTHFLGSDCYDLHLFEYGKIANLLNDGVIRKDLMESGLATILAKEHFDELEKDLREKLEKQKRFTFYEHPKAPFISVKNLYEQLLPSLNEKIEKLKQVDLEMSPKTFQLLMDLYLEQAKIPSFILKQYLQYQESQYSFVQKDPSLPTKDLTLFKMYTVEDWFGPKFVHLCALFIHNMSLYAKEQGYVVTKEEAKADLFAKGFQTLKRQFGGATPSGAELSYAMKNHLQALHLTEQETVDIWQKVLLCRRIFYDYADSVLVDPKLFEDFQAYAQKQAVVDLYQLPKEFQFADIDTFMQFQVYLEAIQNKKHKDSLLLPKECKTAEEVLAVAPELVEKRYLVNLGKVDLQDLALKVSIQEMWQWQLDPGHFAFLQKQFPELGDKTRVSEEERFQMLESLDPKKREELNTFTRLEMVKEHQEWIDQALAECEIRKEIFAISGKGTGLNLEGIEDNKKLSYILDHAAMTEEATEEEKEMREQLHKFTSDGKTYFRIELLDRIGMWEVLTFAEAYERGVLTPKVQEKLQRAYSQEKERQPALLQKEDGSWKTLEDAKEDLCRIVYKEVLQNITKYMQTSSNSSQSKLHSLPFLIGHYFDCMLEKELALAKEGKGHYQNEPSTMEQTELKQKPALINQWQLCFEEVTVHASEPHKVIPEEVFEKEEGMWSQILDTENGNLAFYHIKKLQSAEKDGYSKIRQTQELLGKEAKQHLMHKIMDLFAESGVLHIDPLLFEEEEAPNAA